jgi:hypothetical protein
MQADASHSHKETKSEIKEDICITYNQQEKEEWANFDEFLNAETAKNTTQSLTNMLNDPWDSAASSSTINKGQNLSQATEQQQETKQEQSSAQDDSNWANFD